jgi:hypothetical protein
MSAAVSIRPPVPSDVEYMLKTWLRVMRKSYPRSWPDRLYYDDFQRDIVALTRKAHARVIASRRDPNFIIGFVVGNIYPENKTAVIHFAYVRSTFRRAGLLTQALLDMRYEPGYEIVATFWGPYLDRFERKDLIYNPRLLFKVE